MKLGTDRREELVTAVDKAMTALREAICDFETQQSHLTRGEFQALGKLHNAKVQLDDSLEWLQEA